MINCSNVNSYFLPLKAFMTKHINVQRFINHYHRIEINQKSDSLSAPLKLMSSRMSPRASHRCHQYAILVSSPGSFYRRLFSYIGHKYKTSAFVTGKCRLKVKSAGGTSQDGVKMAYWWRILDMRIEEKGTSFHESWTSG